MMQRNISEQQVKDAVLHPDRLYMYGKGIRRGPKWNFIKSVGGDTLQVSAEFANDTCYIVTAFWKDL
jgi:hypothetical protein